MNTIAPKTRKIGYIKAGPVENIALNDIMKHVITTSTGEDGSKYARYAEGWSDERVLEEAKATNVVRAALPLRSVTDLRLAAYGKIRTPKPDKPALAGNVDADIIAGLFAEELAKRDRIIEDLQRQLAALTHSVAKMGIRVDDVENQNGRIIDRDERTQTHLQGFYQRIHAVEQHLGIEHKKRHETALGEGLGALSFMRPAAAAAV